MILPPEYSWLESYLSNDTLWFEDALNWEDALDLALTDFSLYSFFTTPFFFNVHFFIDFHVKLSFLDIILLVESDKTTYSREFYDFFIWDITSFFQNKFLPTQFFFYSDYQDFTLIMLYYSPELTLALSDYLNIYFANNTINYHSSVVFDLFTDSLNSSLSEFVENLLLFFSFVWIMIIFLNIFRIIKWNNSNELYMTRILLYLYSISRETRIQFETLLLLFFFIVFYWSMLIATFDDDREEFIETFDVSFFYFFCFLIGYLIYKYSIHYFAFLEASVTEGRTVTFITKQFFRDFINSFALLLRFFILLFRLNVYDTLDDFYDSYYIFIGDFDDDEYYSELFFSYYPFMFFQFDSKDDDLYSLENENEFFMDLFYLYFLCWGKLFFFIFFIVEEILRLALGFYICYLIIFEVHAVNASYVEENYFYTKRFQFSSLFVKTYSSSFKL